MSARPLNPKLSIETLAMIAAERFGVGGRIEMLSSERDQNAAIFDPVQGEFVLKIANAAETIDFLRLQNRAIAVAGEAQRNLPVPRILRSRSGEEIELVMIAGQRYAVRLLTRLPGVPLSRLPGSCGLRREIGAAAARLDAALAKLQRDAEHELPWDFTNAPAARASLRLVTEAEQRALLAGVIDDAEATTLPALTALPRQWLHHDLNLNNLLALPEAPERLAGIIDFGDMLWASRVSEIAIAATHQCVRETDPLMAASDVVVAYHATSPLDAREIALVPRLMALRLAMAMLLQRAHAAAGGDGHFDLAALGAFHRALAVLSEIGWNRCAERMQERLQQDEGRE